MFMRKGGGGSRIGEGDHQAMMPAPGGAPEAKTAHERNPTVGGNGQTLRPCLALSTARGCPGDHVPSWQAEADQVERANC